MWTVGISPDVEWAEYPEDLLFEKKEQAISYLLGNKIWVMSDIYGNRPNPWIAEVNEDGEVEGCSCYGRWRCAACNMAKEYLFE